MADVAATVQQIGLALRDPLPWHDVVQIAQMAEDAGYRALFVPEIAGREGFSTLAGLAPEARRLLLGTGVVPVRARRLETMAMAAATVHELSGGRLILGIGAGPPGQGSLDRVRHHLAALRVALGAHPQGAASSAFRVDLDAGPPPPIWVAALGDRMIGLAGEIADGVLLNWCTPERVMRARELVAEGASRADRDAADVTVAVYVRACIDPHEDVALEALRGPTGQYASMPHYRKQMEAMGLGDLARSAAEATGGGRPGDVPDELVRALCVVADAEAGHRLLAAHRRAGADLPIVYPVPARDPVSSVTGTMLALAPSPALQPGTEPGLSLPPEG
jgi:alkanesulfonate monooxygenase SsuD/methylene tetrahydromethanopterin reductase-like flavin-dependent oxidoreductase (luciferase family)